MKLTPIAKQRRNAAFEKASAPPPLSSVHFPPDNSHRGGTRGYVIDRADDRGAGIDAERCCHRPQPPTTTMRRIPPSLRNSCRAPRRRAVPWMENDGAATEHLIPIPLRDVAQAGAAIAVLCRTILRRPASTRSRRIRRPMQLDNLFPNGRLFCEVRKDRILISFAMVPNGTLWFSQSVLPAAGYIRLRAERGRLFWFHSNS